MTRYWSMKQYGYLLTLARQYGLGKITLFAVARQLNWDGTVPDDFAWPIDGDAEVIRLAREMLETEKANT